MQCPSCQSESPASNAFCGQCGAAVVLICVCCDRENAPDHRFCGGCGQRLSAPCPPVLKDRDPRSYTPNHLAEKILTTRSALEGERKQVTVLFADVKGSMELAGQVDAEEWHRILDRFFQILADGVHRFEGTVNQYTGDGIMALFGAPIAHEDHARRACYAALHLRDALRHYADQLRLSRGFNFSVRMGINSGEVVVGKIGDDLRMDYTAQGHTVGLAARMEQIAAADRIYLAEPTARLVEGFFRLVSLGHSKIEGVGAPLSVYELEAAGPMRTRLDVSRARGFSRFVGRAPEFASLEASLERILRGEGQVVGVVAEAGVGKSRLCFEFLEGCRARGILVLEGHCAAHGKSTPFLPALEMFRAYFGIGEQDSAEEARRKIAGTLILLDPAFQETLPLVFDFLGVPDPARPAPRMDPEARQRQLFAFLRHVVEARSEQEPAINFLDDVHWIDSGTDALLAELVEAAQRTRTLVLVNFRPEYHAPWMQKSYYQQLSLRPLGSEAIRELLADLLGSDPSLARLPDLIRERTAGNPFFIEEVVQALAESDSLEGTRGAYQLVRDIDELKVPDTVQAVLAARIDRLPEREKQVLQAASVIGKKFAEPILERIGEVPESDLRASLSALQRAEFVYEEAFYPVAEYSFRHPLTQEVAYGSQLRERRSRLHAAVAQAIERLDPDKLDEQAALVAHHWEKAGEALPAARWHERAARWAGATDATEAVRHWRSVRALLGEAPESRETLEIGLTARTQILALGWRTGITESELEEFFTEGRALADRLDSPRIRTELLVAYALAKTTSGGVASVIRYSLEAAREAERADDLRLRLDVQAVVTFSHFLAGRLREALGFAEEALAWAPSGQKVGPGLWGYHSGLFLRLFRAGIFVEMGRLDEADSELALVHRLAGEAQDADILAWSASWRVLLAYHRGDAAEALAWARRLVDRVDKTGSPGNQVLAHRELGVAHLMNEQWEKAIEAEAQGLEILRQRGAGRFFEAILIAFVAEGHLGAGDPALALERADEAVCVAQRYGTGVYEVCALLARARARLRSRGGAARAEIEADLERALALIRKNGMDPWKPRVHEEQARLARLGGERSDAETFLREAQRLYTEMGATGHAERLGRELEQLQTRA